ncbi:MAG: MFS transporter [Candidatus Eremiobacteraeota bacterium]|nr:MFS transporter [Candidatus Eremiobacteraeota bacterium]
MRGYTVVQIPDEGASSTRTVLFGAISIVLFAAFLFRQATVTNPLLPLATFRSRNICGSNILQVLIAAGMFGFFFLDSLYLRRVLGYNAVSTGIAFLPVTVAVGAFSLGLAAQLAARFGARLMVITGISLAAAGLFVSTFAPLQSSYFASVFPAMLSIGIGMGLSFQTVMMFAMSDATPKNSGAAISRS